jgi:hypothetical protein
MAFTTTQLAALEQAIGQGELEVSYDGKTVKYRSMDELLKAYDFVRTKLIEDGTITSSRRRVSYASFNKD